MAQTPFNSSSTVSLQDAQATVEYDQKKLTPPAIADRIDDMGFGAKVAPSSYGSLKSSSRVYIEGMTCQSCVRNIESNISTVPGVERINVDLDGKFADIVYNTSIINAKTICERINNLGTKFRAATRKTDLEQPKTGDLVKVETDTIGAPLIVHIEGMTCMSCVRNIEDNISRKKGVRKIAVSLEKSRAEVDYDSTLTDAETVRDAIDDMGFDAFLSKTCTLSVEGMTCQSCVRKIESNVSSLPWIESVRVSLESESAVVLYAESKWTAQKLADVVTELGFKSTPSAGERRCTVSIMGMTCQSCVANIEDRVGRTEGVVSIKVSLDEHKGVCVYRDDVLTGTMVADVIDDMGFDAKLLDDEGDGTVTIDPTSDKPNDTNNQLTLDRRVNFDEEEDDSLEVCHLRVTGMTCASCVANIETQLSKVEGVHSVLVALMAQKAEVRYDPAYIMPSQIAYRVEDIGFNAEVLDDEKQGQATLDVAVSAEWLRRHPPARPARA